jgi:hypothetical protein
MSTEDILSYIVIIGIFLAGFVPIVMGIIYYTRENRRLDREEKEKASKAPSHQTV